ncbi:MAG: efflux RND transporter permease subunit [Vampirovibrio sp.]
MLSEFFIKRPIFSIVSALVITLIGLIALPTLPIAQYPTIAPPRVVVTAQYTGADAQVVEDSVTTPLEQAINGVEGMRYMSSNSAADGSSQITITFAQGTDLEDAVVNVQNRINQAQGGLPTDVKATGVKTEKSSGQVILAFAFFDQTKKLSPSFISNYVDRFVLDEVKRIKGVGTVQLFGERKYAMRIWLDPMKLASRGLSVSEVTEALRAQNTDVAAGSLGTPPVKKPLNYQLSLLVDSKLHDPEAFGNVVLKAGQGYSTIRLKDVARLEVGSEDYGRGVWWKRGDAIGLAIGQLPEANALDVAHQVHETLARVSQKFPSGLTYETGFDSTHFVEESIKEVIFTLLLAIGLVIFSIWIFLFDWRVTLIPALTIPVSLLGSFALIKAFGYSINNLTLFGLTLATGLVVDDAIVVVENIARLIKEEGLSPYDAAIKGMKEVFGAVVAISLVLSAVFIPVAMFPGTTGKLYEQFALTIVFTILISTFNALTLTPALSVIFLKKEALTKPPSFILFRKMNDGINGLSVFYKKILTRSIALKNLVLLGFVAVLMLTYAVFISVPKGFVPSEDQGYFIVATQAPEGTSSAYMLKVIQKVEALLLQQPEVEGAFAINGWSFLGSAPNRGMMFVPLKPIGERLGPNQGAAAIIQRLRPHFMQMTEAMVMPFEPPAVEGIGSLGGFSFVLQDQSGTHSASELEAQQWNLIAGANRSGVVSGAFSGFTANTPQLHMTVDREKAVLLGLSIEEVFSTLKVLLGSLYINDFNFNGRVYRVMAQADEAFRYKSDVLEGLYVKNNIGKMIPLSTIVSLTRQTGTQVVSHYNMFRSTSINGGPTPNASSGQALLKMEELANQGLPPGFSYEWTDLSLEQRESGSTEIVLFALGILFVYLVLAAQYESFLDPFIIVLSVPLAVLGAVIGLKLRGLPNDVFSQLGLVMLIGLASKNSILIVEFANHLHEQGMPLVEAAIQASVIRLRPILMTSFSFLFGVWPLVVAVGAGAYARQSLGTSVFFGMLLSTFLTLIIVPVLFVVLKSLGKRKAVVSPVVPSSDR